MQKEPGGSGKATYYDLGEDFVSAMQGGEYPEAIIKQLLNQVPEEDKPKEEELE